MRKGVRRSLRVGARAWRSSQGTAACPCGPCSLSVHRPPKEGRVIWGRGREDRRIAGASRRGGYPGRKRGGSPWRSRRGGRRRRSLGSRSASRTRIPRSETWPPRLLSPPPSPGVSFPSGGTENGLSVAHGHGEGRQARTQGSRRLVRELQQAAGRQAGESRRNREEDDNLLVIFSLLFIPFSFCPRVTSG
jgi:hypothetical protein